MSRPAAGCTSACLETLAPQPQSQPCASCPGSRLRAPSSDYSSFSLLHGMQGSALVLGSQPWQ